MRGVKMGFLDKVKNMFKNKENAKDDKEALSPES